MAEDNIELARRMSYARTIEEIQAVKKEAHEWLQQHPDDLTVLSAGEGLAMMESALVNKEQVKRASA